jgi:hypothetical protein
VGDEVRESSGRERERERERKDAHTHIVHKYAQRKQRTWHEMHWSTRSRVLQWLASNSGESPFSSYNPSQLAHRPDKVWTRRDSSSSCHRLAAVEQLELKTSGEPSRESVGVPRQEPSLTRTWGGGVFQGVNAGSEGFGVQG